jgi:anti-sigma B factor antagonist
MAVSVGSPGAERGTSGDCIPPASPGSKAPRRFARRVMPGATQRFVAFAEQLDSGAPVISVMGEVDRATAPALEQTLLSTTDDQAGEAIVDLTSCSFLDSRGLGVLVAARARLARSNQRLAVVLPKPSVLRIFQITQFDELFEIYPSLRAAADRDGNGNGNGLEAGTHEDPGRPT